jgi:hypothetical protein
VRSDKEIEKECDRQREESNKVRRLLGKTQDSDK